MIYKNTAIRALSLIVALATSFFSYGDEDPASIQHRYMTPSMRVSTNAWLSVSGNVERIVSASTNGLATKSEVEAHVADTNNPHGVTAEQVGALPLVEDANGNKTAVTIGSRRSYVTVGPYSIASGFSVAASGYHSHAEGYSTQIGEDDLFAYAWNGDTRYMYSSHGNGTYNINPEGGLDGFYIGEKTLSEIFYTKEDVDATISATNTTFSNAVLAVGLNIDTNSVAVLNDIANTFGGFPLGAGETATTIGGLLAALAAAVAWLKKNKVGSFASVGGASATVENGVAKLDDFFTGSNSLLNARITYERNATGLKDRAFNALTFDGTEYNLSTALEAVTPTASGQPRDLLIVATATAATTISFTAGTIKGDKPTIDGSGTWLITLTEYASGVWYCRQIKMEDAA